MSADTAFEVGRLYLPLRQIADVLTATGHGVIDVLPGLEQYWTGGTRRFNGQVAEHGGGGTALTEVGSIPTGYDGNAYFHVGNGVNYGTLSTGGGISGLETWIDPTLRGLTVGGWFMVDALPAVAGGLISKSAETPDRGYALIVTSTPQYIFLVSGNGAAAFQAISPTSTISVWRFVVGRFIPSTEVAIFVDGDKTIFTAAIPASLNVSAQAFELGRYFALDAYIAHAKMRDVFVCAAALSDTLIEEVRKATTP